MANSKTGLNFYTIDTDRYQDIRIKRLKKDNGCDGMAVYDYILCEIYRVKGYFLEWDESSAFDVAEYFGLKESKVQGIVQFCASVGLFDKALLSRGIITSASIQQRYLTMCSRAKRTGVEINPDYSLIDNSRNLPDSSRSFSDSSVRMCDSSRSLPQSKVKESKETSLSRGKENIPPPVIAPIPLTDCYNQLIGNVSWKEAVLLNIHSTGYRAISSTDIDKWITQFFSNLAAQGEDSKQIRDAQSHFVRWLKIELKKLKDEEDRNTNSRKQNANRYALNQLTSSYNDMADTLSDPF